MKSSAGDQNDLMIQLQSGAVDGRLPAGPPGRVGPVLRPRPPHAFADPWPRSSAGSSSSDKAWASIPAELHQPFLDAVTAASRGLYEETMTLEADAVKMMKENGLVVHDPPAAALAKWREAAGRAVDGLIGPVFSKEIYDQIMAYVQEYRKARGQ